MSLEWDGWEKRPGGGTSDYSNPSILAYIYSRGKKGIRFAIATENERTCHAVEKE